jgi:predicted Fe-S protein YdhL (DUF1289 family)
MPYTCLEAVQEPDVAIKSPCADICRFDRKASLCVGCFRTQEEIRQWNKMTDHKRRQILAERARREAKVAGRRRGVWSPEG